MISSGTRLGPYEILSPIGAGGMGEVWRAGSSPGPRGCGSLLFEKPGIRGYDVAPDGKGFYAVFQPPDSGIVRELHLVTNWFEELNRLAPAGKR